MKKIKENKGITLISLVITIIIISILAGISLGALTGDKGLVTEAKNVKKDAIIADLKEDLQRKILLQESKNKRKSISEDQLEAILTTKGTLSNEENVMDRTLTTSDGYEIKVSDIWSGSVSQKVVPGQPNGDKVFTVASTIDGGKAGTYNPLIPAGFKPLDAGIAVWGDGTSAPTQTAVNSGLVIQHGVDKSEYVWIPVEGLYTGSDADKTAVSSNSKVLLGRYVFNTTSGVIDTTLSQSEPSGQLKVSSTDPYYRTEGLKNSTKTNTHAKDIEGFISSVETNGGYYIARYEASKGANERALSIVSQGKTTAGASSVLENYLWNNITQPVAATACQNLYEGINSDLVNSYAWDTALLFIQKNSGNADYSIDKSGNTKADGTNSGLQNTGPRDVKEDKVCNIYDMSGNCYEWTTETYSNSSYPCTFRGGDYDNSGHYASNRFSSDTSGSSFNLSFRPLLYL